MRLICLAIALSPCPAPAQDAQGELNPKVFRLTGVLATGVEKEIRILREIAGLDDDAANQVRREIVPVTLKVATRLVHKADDDDDFRTIHFAQLPRELQAKVATAVSQLAKDQAAAAKVKEDVRLRVAFHQRITIDGFVALIDHAALLSSEQLTKIQTLGKQLAEKEQLPNCRELMRYGMPDKQINETLKKLLTAKQFERWEKVKHGLGREDGLVTASTLSAEERRKELATALTEMGNTYIDWYDGELSLSATQIHRMQLVMKGVIGTAIRAQLEQLEQQARTIAGDTKPQHPIGLETDLSIPFTTTRWFRFVRATLTPEQAVKFDTFRDRRGQRFGRLMASFLIVGMSSGQSGPGPGSPAMFMNAKQQAQTHTLIAKAIGPIEEMGPIAPEHFLKLLEVPEQKFSAAMGEKNWNRFQPLMNQLRNAAKKQAEAAKAKAKVDE